MKRFFLFTLAGGLFLLHFGNVSAAAREKSKHEGGLSDTTMGVLVLKSAEDPTLAPRLAEKLGAEWGKIFPGLELQTLINLLISAERKEWGNDTEATIEKFLPTTGRPFNKATANVTLHEVMDKLATKKTVTPEFLAEPCGFSKKLTNKAFRFFIVVHQFDQHFQMLRLYPRR